MLDGRWKSAQDRFWDHAGRVLAKTGISANQVTLAGTALMLLHCAGFVLHRDAFWFGIGIAVFELTDNLDGAVARASGTSSPFGAYLDAVTDRYKDIAVLAAIGHVTGHWALVFAAASGALLTSYAKARAGMEARVSNEAWPDLFERLERIIVLCAGLILGALLPRALVAGRSLLWCALALLAVGTHVTALQRFARAHALLTRRR